MKKKTKQNFAFCKNHFRFLNKLALNVFELIGNLILDLIEFALKFLLAKNIPSNTTESEFI